MGNFTPPAFATVPTHVSCGAFAYPKILCCLRRLQGLSLQKFFISPFRRGWSTSSGSIVCKNWSWRNTTVRQSQSRRKSLVREKLCTLTVNVHTSYVDFQCKYHPNKAIATPRDSSLLIAISWLPGGKAICCQGQPRGPAMKSQVLNPKPRPPASLHPAVNQS